MKTWRLVGVGALCAAFAWGCEQRPVGERSAVGAEPVNGVAQSPAQSPEVNAQPARAQAEAPPEAPARAQQQPAQQQVQQQAQGEAQPEGQQQAQAPSEEASRAVRDEAATVIVPGDGLSEEVVQDAERATADARGAGEGDRIAVANVEFEGRLQRVGNGRVVVRDGEGNEYEAQLEDDSRVMRGQRQVAARQLRAGTEVRASFDLVEGDFVVKELEQLSTRRQGRSGPRR